MSFSSLPLRPFHPHPSRRAARGFTLVELMISIALSLGLIAVMLTVYQSTRAATKRQEQLSEIQQGVRTAFEYLATDARMIGHRGCFTRRAAGLSFPGLTAGTLDTNYQLGVEGFDFALTGDALAMGSANPTDDTSASNWTANGAAAPAIANLPLDTVSGAGLGLTPGSDVLVIRSVVGQPVRLTLDPATSGSNTTLTLENTGARCSNGADGLSGFCAGSHGLIANCTAAQFFTVPAAPAGNTMVTGNALVATYTTAAEVFPVHTVAYYVKRGASGTGPSLYRRVFDGTTAGGLEEELIDGVETMQVQYGIDSNADNIRDGNYVTASAVTNWDTVMTVRVSLLMRTTDQLEGGNALATGATVGGVAVTYPVDADDKRTDRFDRQVFTTTIALRNRIAYF